MSRRQINIRLTDTTARQLDALTTSGYSITSAVTVAIDRLYRDEITNREERTMDTDDRVEQVNWILQFADSIAQNMGEGTAEELVEYALSDEGREPWGIELPTWFDDHDRRLLTREVARILA